MAEFDMTTRENNAAISMDGTDFIADLTKAEIAYCSLVPETEEERKQLFNAINQPAHKLSEMIGKVITICNVYCETIQMVSEKTGEVVTAPRIVLFDDQGNSYQCVSIGIFGALKKVFQIFGAPDTWQNPLQFEVKQLEKGAKRLLSLNLV